MNFLSKYQIRRTAFLLNSSNHGKNNGIIPEFNRSFQSPLMHQNSQKSDQFSSSAVRRNDSYLGSLGRPKSVQKLAKKSRETGQKPHTESDADNLQGAPTSSTFVTLV